MFNLSLEDLWKCENVKKFLMELDKFCPSVGRSFESRVELKDEVAFYASYIRTRYAHSSHHTMEYVSTRWDGRKQQTCNLANDYLVWVLLCENHS